MGSPKSVREVKTQYNRLPTEYGLDRLADAVASVRLLPRSDGCSPALRLMGRQPQTLLAKFRPPLAFARANVPPRFAPGDLVYFRVYPLNRKGPKWADGTVARVHGNSVCDISTEQGMIRRHFSQMQLNKASGPHRPSPAPGVSSPDG